MTSAPSSRETTLAGQLARLGFREPARAERLLGDRALAGLMDPMEAVFDDGLIAALSSTADPDRALLGLVRLMESLAEFGAREDAADLEQRAADPARLLAIVRSGGPVRDRLLAVLGGSAALGDHLARHPDDWSVLESDEPWSVEALRSELIRAVGGDPALLEPVAGPGVSAYDGLRRAY